MSSNMNHNLKLLTVQDLARMLQVSVRTIWRMRRCQQLPPPIQIGKSLRWHPEKIQAWLNPHNG